jgi:hypothetical protein
MGAGLEQEKTEGTEVIEEGPTSVSSVCFCSSRVALTGSFIYTPLSVAIDDHALKA